MLDAKSKKKLNKKMGELITLSKDKVYSEELDFGKVINTITKRKDRKSLLMVYIAIDYAVKTTGQINERVINKAVNQYLSALRFQNEKKKFSVYYLCLKTMAQGYVLQETARFFCRTV